MEDLVVSIIVEVLETVFVVFVKGFLDLEVEFGGKKTKNRIQWPMDGGHLPRIRGSRHREVEARVCARV